jgi:hypothetical protein
VVVAVVEVSTLVVLEVAAQAVETMVEMALQIQVVAEEVLMLGVQQVSVVQALSFFATPAQFNISLVAQ